MIELLHGDCIIEHEQIESGSTGMACINTHRDFVGIELDKDYYNAAIKRYKQHKAQLVMF